MQPEKFFQNLEQINVADTASQAYAGTGARPRTPDDLRDVEPRPLSDHAGPGRPAFTEYHKFFDIEPDSPVFKMPRLPTPRMVVTEMSATRTDVTLRHTTHEASLSLIHI